MKTISLPLARGGSKDVPLDQAVLIAQDRQKRGDHAVAQRIFELVLEADPEHGDAQFFLGLLKHQTGRTDEALPWMAKAIERHPGEFKYHYLRGIVCDEARMADESIASYRRALAIDPQPIAWHNLGKVLHQTGDLDGAVQCYRTAIERFAGQPSVTTHANLANVLQQLGQLDDAVAIYARLLAQRPEDAALWSNSLFMLNSLPAQDAAQVFAAHRAFGERFDRPMPPRPPALDREAGVSRRIRVGYVSPDFREHAVSTLFESTLAAHDAGRFEVFGYSNRGATDAVTARLQARAAQWRVIHKRSVEEVAALIRQDGIDILVDLAGHTADNSLPVFGRKPAPVQATWIGYPTTTGLRTMDWRITDAIRDPVGATEAFHTERLMRLPETCTGYLPPAGSPPVSPRGSAVDGAVMFGSFNRSTKLNAAVLEVWADILRRVPRARLTLKNRGFHSPALQSHIAATMRRHGVDPGRLVFLDSDPYLAHLARYGDIDVALDPFPYNGDLTTCDALWMGVPVVALVGGASVSRMSASRLHAVGLPELAANTTQEYADLAVALAQDGGRLASLRRGLRERMAASPMMDAPRFTRHLEDAYRAMWAQHVAANAEG
jgi:predicted O-linked N-acetylglucosamine transferase (SPINDLY family)